MVHEAEASEVSGTLPPTHSRHTATVKSSYSHAAINTLCVHLACLVLKKPSAGQSVHQYIILRTLDSSRLSLVCFTACPRCCLGRSASGLSFSKAWVYLVTS